MTELSAKDFNRKIRKGNKESLISLSNNFLESKKLSQGDIIDLRTLDKSNIENDKK